MFKFYVVHFLLLLLVVPFISQAQQFGGNPSTIHWKQINSPAARVIFPAGIDSQANRIHNVIAMLDTATLYSIGNKKRKWNVVLLNQTTQSNAYVRLAPVLSEFYMMPEQNSFSNGSLRWDDNLVIHEDRHMQQFSNFNNGLTKVFSFLLGQEGQLLANGITVPDYFFEGDAVWQETLVSKQGRGRMPSFYNSWKSLQLSKKNYSWMKIRSGSLRDFTPDHYETGYQLVAYGYEKYGEDFWRKVTTDAVNFKGLFYAFNKAIERHSGKTYTQFRNDALQYFVANTIIADKEKLLQNHFITPTQQHNVVDYLFPAFVNDDTVVVTKQSYKEINSFYFIINGREEKIRVKDYVTDDYFSYKNGKIVYAAYQSDPLRANRNYSVIQMLDIYTKEQKQLTFKSKYFSPDISDDGSEMIAVQVNADGSNFLHRLNTNTGELISQLPNTENYFFTQVKYVNNNEAVAAVRHVNGTMALVKIDILTGALKPLMPFTYNVVGYPSVKNDTVFYTMMDAAKSLQPADKIFAVNLKTFKNYQLTNNVNGIYQPIVNSKGDVLVSSFTAEGHRLQQFDAVSLLWKELTTVTNLLVNPIGNVNSIQQKGALALYSLKDTLLVAMPYKKSFQLFNFHSARPVANDPEYGYSFYGNNILSTFNNSIDYMYNRNEQSHTIGYNAVFAGLFPFINMGTEYSFNRNIDTALGKGIQFNSAKIQAGFYVPLTFIGGRTFKFLNFGAGYNVEQIPYIGIGKDVFSNRAFKYANAFFSFSNVSRQARQHINPRWAQTIAVNYREAYSFFKGRKFVGATSFYFPGLSANHSLVFNIAFQKRDSLPDLFSNNFSYSRGYQALNTRQMYKLGINYNFPLLYPDWGAGNAIFFQRIRANAFYDYTNVKARVNGLLSDIINRSAGGEIYFDTKIWNALPATIGIRYSHLLDIDLRNPRATGRWEIILPINLIPN